MKTYLVTGGAGFIGSNFIRYMMEKEKEAISIINLDLLTYAGNIKNVARFESMENYHFFKGDIRDYDLVDSLFLEHDIDYVVNFAAESHVDRSISDPGIFLAVNIKGTQVLLEIAMKHWYLNEEDAWKRDKKFLQISTDEVYGSLGEIGFFTEESPINPHSPYSASKAGADLIVKAYHDTYGLPVNITRCSNNYGPRQFPEKLIPLMINNAMNGKPLPVYGDGHNIRDWIYVEDHCRAIDLVLNRGKNGEVYNIGGNNELQNIRLVRMIIAVLIELLPMEDRRSLVGESLIHFVKDRKGHDRRYAINPDKIKNELGFVPDTPFKEGLRKTVSWYIEHEDWLIDIVSGEYQNYYNKHYEKLGGVI